MNDDLDEKIWASGLNDGEYVCDQCNGFGLITVKTGDGMYPIFDDVTGLASSWKQCPQCEGNGKIDWVRHARGKM